MPSYRVMLGVPRELILFVSALLAARRRSIGTRKKTRKPGCYRQALSGLAWFGGKADIRRLGAGSGLSQATAYRYLAEVIDVPAEQAPGLREAPERAVAGGTPYVILDGKVAGAGRCHEKTLSRKGAVIDLWYSGKKKDSGGNVQALFYPDGRPMWVSEVLPGNVNDLSAAREMVLSVIGEFTAEMPCPADGGYEGAGHGILTPVKRPKKTPELDISARTRNELVRSLRCMGERGFALLTQRWRTLRLVTMSPGKTGETARAALVLTLFEHKMIS